jgi:hypothetical protein
MDNFQQKSVENGYISVHKDGISTVRIFCLQFVKLQLCYTDHQTIKYCYVNDSELCSFFLFRFSAIFQSTKQRYTTVYRKYFLKWQICKLLNSAPCLLSLLLFESRLRQKYAKNFSCFMSSIRKKKEPALP